MIKGVTHAHSYSNTALICGFLKKSFIMNTPLWVEHLNHHFLVGLLCCNHQKVTSRCSTHKGAFIMNDFLRNPHFSDPQFYTYTVNNSKIKSHFYFHQLFSADNKTFLIFAPKKFKKPPSKVAQKYSFFFFITALRCPNGPNRSIKVPKCGL